MGQQQQEEEEEEEGRHAQLITGKVREAHYGSILTLLRMMMMMMMAMMMMMTVMMMVIMTVTKREESRHFNFLDFSIGIQSIFIWLNSTTKNCIQQSEPETAR